MPGTPQPAYEWQPTVLPPVARDAEASRPQPLGLRPVAAGFGWQSVNTVARQAINFFANVILARLLTPADFGLVSIALMFSMWVGIVGDAGIGAALIRQTTLTEDLKRVGFWVALASALLAGVLLAVLAVPICEFYAQPALRPLLAVNALCLAVGGLNAVPGALLRRSLNFRKVALVEIGGTVASALMAVTLAGLHFGAVSIPLGSLAGLLASLALYALLRLLRVWPWPQWNQIRALGLFPFFASGARVMEVLRVSVDNALIGRLMGPTTLGYYGFSYNLIAVPEYRVVGLVTQVAFPALSRLHVDLASVRTAYLRLLRYVLLIVLPALLGLQLVADRVIPLIYGPQWEPAVPVIQILCLSGIGSALATLTDAPLLALGYANRIFRLNVAWLVLLGAGLTTAIAARGGLVAVAVVVSAVSLLLCVWRNAITLRLCRVPALAALIAIGPALAAAAVMVAAVVAYKHFANWPAAGWPQVAAAIVLGAAVYGLMALSLLPELRAIARRWLAARREANHANL